MSSPSSEDPQARLEFRLRMEALILRVARRFLSLGPDAPIDGAIEETLAEVGEFAEVDSTYLVQLDVPGSTFSVTHRWVRQGVHLDALIEKVPVTRIPKRIAHLQTGHPQVLDDIEEADLSDVLREQYRRIGARSILAVPLLAQGGRLTGWIGLLVLNEPRRWSEGCVTLARFAAQTFADALRRHRDERALRRSEARFRAFLEQNPNGMYVLELDPPPAIDAPMDEQVEAILQARVVLCNEVGAQFFGSTVEKVVGRRFQQAFVGLSEDPVELLRADSRQFVERGYRIQVDETPWQMPDGRQIWVARSAHGVVEGGHLTTVWATARDITEQKRARDEHEVMAKRLRQAERLESVGLLAGGVAHDFNNLLLAILGNADLALLHEDKPERVHESLQEIRRAGQRAAELTRQLLAFSRRQPAVKKPVDLNELLGSTWRMLERVLPETIELDFTPGHDLGAVLGDEAQIEQLVLNLCVNARDAMPRGGHLRIETRNSHLDEEHCRPYPQARPGRYVQLAVSDTGHGMPPDRLEHIFEPFFTTKSSGQGTGLGLATVYGIVQQHGGLIQVHSEPDSGTTFEIHLPVTEHEAEGVDDDIRPPPPGGHETVLLAEDEPQVRTVARRILERAGYTVVEVDDGAEALRCFQDEPERFAAVILDIVMPGMDGRQVRTRMRAIRSNVPVVLSTGYTGTVLDGVDPEEMDRALLAKPYDPSQLLFTVRQAIDGVDAGT